MGNQDNIKYHNNERTEEVQDLIDRMPTRFGIIVGSIVLVITSLLLLFGYIVRYPDIVSGQIVVNTSVSPIKLVAASSGKLILRNIKSQDSVKQDYVIAYIQNPAQIDTVLWLYKKIQNYSPNSNQIVKLLNILPPKISLGEITPKYYTFINSLIQLNNLNKNLLFDKQIQSLVHLNEEQDRTLESSKEKLTTSMKLLDYTHKFFVRDSILYIKKVVSEADFDKTNITYLQSKDNYQSTLNSLINSRQQIEQTSEKIKEIEIQKDERYRDVKISLITAYNDLKYNIEVWEQKYLFKSPFNGQIQFLKFWTNNQFVQSGETIFTIIPPSQTPYGQVSLPAIGAGKLKIGQEVIIKLNDFPYTEYGSIEGRVKSISLTTNIEKTDKGLLENYLVTVQFPKGLETNYHKNIDFKFESKGSAEIITKDRRLIERFFDNIKYVLNK